MSATHKRDYLVMWCQALLGPPHYTIQDAINVVGVHDKHLGPRIDRARFRVQAQPSARFAVGEPTGRVLDENSQSYQDWTVFGILDVLITAEPGPILGITLIFEELDADPICSSQMAFRMAGRDAAQKIIAAAKSGRGFKRL